jgi:hypothetical protein
MTWLDRVAAAKHRMLFDIGSYDDGGGLHYARNYLNGMRDGWGAEAPDVIAILGISGNAYPLVFNDAMWAKYAFGESTKTNDPRTLSAAQRNVFWQAKDGEPMADYAVDVLQRRGAQVIFCNNVFRGVLRGLMAKTGRKYDDLRHELSSNFLPGVIVVPAMVAAMGVAQSRGCAYVYAGACCAASPSRTCSRARFGHRPPRRTSMRASTSSFAPRWQDNAFPALRSRSYRTVG